jgi:hypothetical protein
MLCLPAAAPKARAHLQPEGPRARTGDGTMRRKRLAWVPLIVLLACVWAPPALAQADIRGQIEGTLVDGRGQALPGVTVTLEGSAVFGPRGTVSDKQGNFRFPALPVGRYMLKAELVGYQSFVTTDIILNAGETRHFPMTLYEGLVERVTVVAEQNVVDTHSTQSREVLDQDYVNALPLSARRYQQIFSLFPGITNHSDSSEAQFHLHGGTTYQIGYRVDGATINGPDTGRFRLNINQNAVERFEVISGGIPAEYGEQSSGILNAITRSGSNTPQFFYSGTLRNASFAARQGEIDALEQNLTGDRTFNNPIRQQQQWQEFYASGPIVKDKLWYFFAGQYWQENLGGLVATEQTGSTPVNVDNYKEGDRYNFQLKVDWQANPDNHMAFNLFTDPARFKNIELLPTVSQETNRNHSQGGYLFQTRDTHLFSSNTFLETQYFLHHQYLATRPANPGAGLFIQNNDTGLFTGAFYSDQDNTFDRHRVTSSLTHVRGPHTLKGGFDYSFLDYGANYRKENWIINLSGGSGPYLIVDYGADDEVRRSENELAAFLQDRMTLFGGRMTVDAGARYQRQSLIGDGNVAPRLGVSVDPVGDGRTRVFANWGHFYDSVFFQVMDRFDHNDGLTVFYDTAPDCTGGPCVPIQVQTYAIPERLTQPRKVQWQAGVERELAGSFRIGVTHTEWSSDNDILSTFDNTTGENFLYTNGRSEYRGTELTLRKPFGRRMEVFGSYTRSSTRSQQNNSEELSFLRGDDPLATAFTRASYDRPNVINLSGRIHLPGNFDVTAIYRYQDGTLISPQDVNGEIDPAWGKNSYRLPPFRTFDLHISRGVEVGRAKLKFVAQVYNLTNQFNVVSVGARTDVTAPNINFLGTAQIVDIPRTVQAGVEIHF